MSQAIVTLTLNPAAGNEQLVIVDSKRFTIGRSPDNDLVIDNSSLSRRHAIIENFDGTIQLSDCGSQNGTRINGAVVTGGAVLCDGDVISLGDVCDLTVRIREQVQPPVPGKVVTPAPSLVARSRPTPPPATPSARATPARQRAPASSGSWFNVPLIAVCSIVFILLISGLLLLVFSRGDKGTKTTRPVREVAANSQSADTATETATTVVDIKDTDQGKKSDITSGLPPEELVEKAAIQVMHRVSSDDKSYSFSDKALHDIQQKVAEYEQSPTLAASLASLQRHGSSLAAQARLEGIEPGLFIYAALAQADGGRNGVDPVATAHAILPDLLALRATFGINDADSSLILIAAFKMGVGEKRSHPLLAVMRRLVNNPLTQRNVWYLNEKGGIDQRSYDFVLNFLALGVISQDPRQFGIPSDPLSF